MMANELKLTLQDALSKLGISGADIRVQKDAYQGWRVAIVSDSFASMSQSSRHEAVKRSLEGLTIQWLDLVTTEESQWMGSLLGADVEPEQLPLWPEALARGNSTNPNPLFPSDFDDDLALPIVATFYSLRGGVGRSTALAYTAHILGSRGYKVVCVDLDVEAPGLAALFGKESEILEGSGVVRTLLDIDQDLGTDLSKQLIRVSENYDIYCFPAGLPSANYARQLSLLDPEAWYREEKNPLQILLDRLATGLPFRPDVILLDSRTGITRFSGPLLFDLADLAFVLFFPHPQSRRGTGELVQALKASHTRRIFKGGALAPEPRFVVSPIPSSKVPEVVQRYRHRAAEWIHEWLSRSDTETATPWTESEITHFIPYQDVLASSDAVFNDVEIWKPYLPLADWIQRFLPTSGEASSVATIPSVKKSVLTELRFPGGTAEDQDKDNLLGTFVETELVHKATLPSVPLVLGRKGTGKTALFRWLSERSTERIVMLAPSKLREAWQPSADAFKAAETMLKQRGLEWREFWLVYACLACHYSTFPNVRDLLPDPSIRGHLAPSLSSESDLIKSIERILSLPDGTMQAGAWLSKLDSATNGSRLILIDGLDSGFGSATAERERRTHAVEGLFTFLTDRTEQLSHLKFKIMLREDIWKKLKFENKSHLFGRSVRLAWDNQAAYLSIILRQALRAPSFQALVSPEDISGISEKPVRPESVYRVWSTLVGERMKGGKTTYTSNWVWNRLADSNDDRGPRTLLQLFQLAVGWEQREHQANPYDKSVVRPRALMLSLDQVSEEAVAALIEEFSELESLTRKLTEIGKTPVWASELEPLAEHVALGREVGLLSVYEGTETEPIKYRVPDIYRIGLHMSRMGQL